MTPKIRVIEKKHKKGLYQNDTSFFKRHHKKNFKTNHTVAKNIWNYISDKRTCTKNSYKSITNEGNQSNKNSQTT